MISIVFILQIILFPPIVSAENVPEPPEKSMEELYHDLFLTLLSPAIQNSVDEYYAQSLSESPIVYLYMVDIISVKRVYGYRSFRFRVIMDVTPVIGPHISVGKDRLTYDVGSGQPKLIGYEHIETHSLPENWEHIVKNEG